MAELDAGKIQPFQVEIPQSELVELQRRLSDKRWPEAETVEDWSQGAPLSFMQEICQYWKNDYDWRVCESSINDFGSYKVKIGGLDIHFLHIRSSHDMAKPLVLTHGWPGSIIEFFELIPILTEPEKHGGQPEDAFHLVIPSLPGFGFSGKPSKPGWTVERIADAWAVLMQVLGYKKYVAQGGDWGAFVSTALASAYPDECVAAHINLVVAPPDKAVMVTPEPAEAAALLKAKEYQQRGTGYALQQASRPQTLAYGLTDSPVGQAAWILEKFYEWSDNRIGVKTRITQDRLLDNVMMYWLTASAASSARLYWQSFFNVDMSTVSAAIGMSIFPKEIATPSRRWAEGRFKNIVYWNQLEQGGHFPAMEQPEELANEIRKCFRNVHFDSYS